jgi:hypothetical protein
MLRLERIWFKELLLGREEELLLGREEFLTANPMRFQCIALIPSPL